MTVRELQARGYKLTQIEVDKLNKQLLAEYKIALDEIRAKVSKIYTTVLDGVDKRDWFFEMNKYNRLSKIKMELRKVYSSIKISNTIIEGSELGFNNNYFRQQYSLAWMQQTIFKNVNEDQLVASILGKINNRNASIFIPKYGNVVQTMKNNKAATIAKLDGIMNQAIIQGKGARTISREIKDLLGISAKKAMTISRTEVMRNMNNGSYAAYLGAREDGVELGRMLIATLDSRTREQSGNMDKQIANKDGLFRYPNGAIALPGNTGNPAYDINDRETVIEIVKGFEPETRIGRNPVTGKNETMDFIDFPEWMKRNNLKRDRGGKIVKK